jgi:NAD(P)-dependent dehydrogenase (short-subunit alcohol dehydrogenase family)
MLGRSLRLELAPHGASAGVLYPGWVATPIANAARGHNATATALTQHAFRGPLGKIR